MKTTKKSVIAYLITCFALSSIFYVLIIYQLSTNEYGKSINVVSRSSCDNR